jgi:hypothetical protein
MKTDAVNVEGNQHLLVYLGKVLSTKSGDKTLADKIREQNPLPVGEHDIKGVIEFSLHAKVGEDYKTDRYKGVSLDEVLTWTMATVPGFMEDKLRRAAAIVIELKRAETEQRQPKAIEWIDKKGVVRKISPLTIMNEKIKTQAWKERAQETLAPFSKVIKQSVPAKGRLSVSDVQVKITDGKPSIPLVRVGSAK